jgi:integrase/recombinase XerD
MSRAAGAGDDRQLIEAFLEMLAAEAGAARNTLLAYRRDLEGASMLLNGGLAAAEADALERLGAEWMALKRSSVARKGAALRRFFGFLHAEGMRADDPSPALPRPGRIGRCPRC